MTERKSELQTNKNTWDFVAGDFFGGTALPKWGVFDVEKDNKGLIGETEGKTFVEIGCGSGHSTKYLVERGASRVYALDLSHTQIEFSRETNKKAIEDGKVALFEQPMEVPIYLPEKVDTVFSIYAIGWTVNPTAVFKNINSYLKLGGKFVWSWEHPMYPKVKHHDGQIVVTKSYHDEELRQAKSWGTEEGIHMAVRKLSTWYNLLRQNGFEVLEMLEPPPLEIKENQKDPTRYYSVPRAELVPATIIFNCIKTREVTDL